MKLAVIKTGGKQYLVAKDQEIIVEKLDGDKDKQIELEMLALMDTENEKIDLGKPALKEKAKVAIVDQLKGDKIRVARFRAKSRYRKVRGHRQKLTKIRIVSF